MIGFTREEVEAENKRGGRLPLPHVIRHRVRYFTAGVGYLEPSSVAPSLSTVFSSAIEAASVKSERPVPAR